MGLFNEDAERRRRELAKKAALSGGISGALLSAGTGLLGGEKSLGKLGLSALEGSLLGGSASGAATYAGSHLLGNPEDSDSPSAFTDTAAVGGAAGGGLLGAGLGAALGSRRIPLMEKLLESPNLLSRGFNAVTKAGGRRGALIGALVGGAGLGAASSAFGADEGMQLDLINNKVKEGQRTKRREELINGF